MKTSSAKAKGRELCKTVKATLLKRYKTLSDDDIKVTSSGATGEDLQFSPLARTHLPISLECKNHAKFAIYKHYEQAKSNAKDYIPILVIKQNRDIPLVVISLEHFMELI